MSDTGAQIAVLRKTQLASFTLVEMLTVMAIIAALATIVAIAGLGILKKSLRSRASSEIQALTTALNGYQVDNGIYPNTNLATTFGMPGTLLTNSGVAPYSSTTADGTTLDYINTSQTLYLALSGQTNFTDITPNKANKTYFYFKRNQVKDTNTGSYVVDPWGYSYGYSTGTGNGGATTNYPFNGNGFFDLWSTGGLLKAKANSAAWIANWQVQ